MKTLGIDASRANVRQRTGTEWYCFHLLQELVRLIPLDQYQVTIYVKAPLVEDLRTLAEHWQVRVLRWPPRLLWTQLRLSLAMLRKSRRPDLLFIPAHTIPLIHPQQTVYVAHDLGFEREPQLYANTYIGGRIMNIIIRLLTFGKYGTSELDYHRWSMRFAVKKAAKIIAISQFTKTELQHFYSVPNERVAVIYNGYNKPAAEKDATAPAPERDLFLYIGRIEHKKNILNLLEAYAQFITTNSTQNKLCLIGQFGFGQAEIMQKISELKLTNKIILPGYVLQTELAQYWKRAIAFVFPTNYEGFGIPILEAMSAGVVVACSDIAPLREVGGNACVYFNQQSPRAICSALQNISKLSNTERAQYIAAGQQRASQFSWKRCADETWQVLKAQLD
ncbi:MAG: glycosyl transferase, group 1 [uncultured bacterium]|nr:MAG: glycosyl transferase, group 1 [uncultured bacterium]